jgi:hypothetical protein
MTKLRQFDEVAEGKKVRDKTFDGIVIHQKISTQSPFSVTLNVEPQPPLRSEQE